MPPTPTFRRLFHRPKSAHAASSHRQSPHQSEFQTRYRSSSPPGAPAKLGPPKENVLLGPHGESWCSNKSFSQNRDIGKYSGLFPVPSITTHYEIPKRNAEIRRQMLYSSLKDVELSNHEASKESKSTKNIFGDTQLDSYRASSSCFRDMSAVLTEASNDNQPFARKRSTGEEPGYAAQIIHSSETSPHVDSLRNVGSTNLGLKSERIYSEDGKTKHDLHHCVNKGNASFTGKKSDCVIQGNFQGDIGDVDEMFKLLHDRKPNISQSRRTACSTPSKRNKRSKSRSKRHTKQRAGVLDGMFSDVFRNLITGTRKHSEGGSTQASDFESSLDDNNCHLNSKDSMNDKPVLETDVILSTTESNTSTLRHEVDHNVGQSDGARVSSDQIHVQHTETNCPRDSSRHNTQAENIPTINDESACAGTSHGFHSGDAHPPIFCLSINESRVTEVAISAPKTIFTKSISKNREKSNHKPPESISMTPQDNNDLTKSSNVSSASKIPKHHQKQIKSSSNHNLTSKDNFEIQTNHQSVSTTILETGQSESTPMGVTDHQVLLGSLVADDSVERHDHLFEEEIVIKSKYEENETSNTNKQKVNLSLQEHALSDSNVSKIDPILADIKRYPSFNDLTDITDDDSLTADVITMRDTQSLTCMGNTSLANMFDEVATGFTTSENKEQTSAVDCHLDSSLPDKVKEIEEYPDTPESKERLCECASDQRYPICNLPAYRVFRELEKRQLEKKDNKKKDCNYNSNSNTHESESSFYEATLATSFKNLSDNNSSTTHNSIYSKTKNTHTNNKSSKSEPFHLKEKTSLTKTPRVNVAYQDTFASTGFINLDYKNHHQQRCLGNIAIDKDDICHKKHMITHENGETSRLNARLDLAIPRFGARLDLAISSKQDIDQHTHIQPRTILKTNTNKFDFISKCKHHQQKCDHIISSSSRLVKLSEIMSHSAGQQMAHVCRCLDILQTTADSRISPQAVSHMTQCLDSHSSSDQPQ